MILVTMIRTIMIVMTKEESKATQTIMMVMTKEESKATRTIMEENMTMSSRKASTVQMAMKGTEVQVTWTEIQMNAQYLVCNVSNQSC